MGTPQGDTGAADLSYVEAVVSEIARDLSGYKVIVEKSTVPVYTNEWICACSTVTASIPPTSTWPPIPSSCARAPRSWIFCIRTASWWAPTPSARPICSGASTPRSLRAPITASRARSPGRAAPARPAPLLVTSAQSAEILKHASNAFLALKISFINAVANLAESVDANIEDIAAGMGMDSRIGPRFLRAGLGYGGSCFPKDVAAFHWVAQQHGLSFQLLEEVRRINDAQREVFFNKVRSALMDPARQAAGGAGPGLQGRHRRYPRVARARYRPAAARWRRPCARLRSRGHGARPRSHAALHRLTYVADLYEAAQDADAALILTEWDEFAHIDLPRLKRALKFPIVIDGRNLYRPETMAEHGFTYVSIGRPGSFNDEVAKPKKTPF